jgi:hypothetical protein
MACKKLSEVHINVFFSMGKEALADAISIWNSFDLRDWDRLVHVFGDFAMQLPLLGFTL